MIGVRAFIFARGGSKGIPDKNLQCVGGRSLIERAVRAAQDCHLVEDIVCSTDSLRIAEAAERAGARVPFLRPDDLASDMSSELDAWRHAIQFFADHEGKLDFRTFVSVPPTAPLRWGSDIARCIRLFDETACDLVVTGTPARRHPSFNMVLVDDGGRARLVKPTVDPVVRRQDAEPIYDLTTVAYVARPSYVLSCLGLLDGDVRLAEIAAERAVDIDTPLDLAYANFIEGSFNGA